MIIVQGNASNIGSGVRLFDGFEQGNYGRFRTTTLRVFDILSTLHTGPHYSGKMDGPISVVPSVNVL